MIEERQKLEKILGEVESFMQTSAYLYLIQSEVDNLAGTVTSILEFPPTDLPSLFLSLQNHGARTILKQNIKTFEDACANLKARIDEMIESENSSTQNQNEN